MCNSYKHSVQIAQNNYDILHNTKVKEKYPNLYQEVYAHDKICHSSWYKLSDLAYKEYTNYIQDTKIGYKN